MLDEIVDACVSSKMHVPCDLSGWERLRQSIAQAISLAFAPSMLETPGIVQSPFDTFVALLIKDQEPREYDFTATITESGAHQPSSSLRPCVVLSSSWKDGW